MNTVLTVEVQKIDGAITVITRQGDPVCVRSLYRAGFQLGRFTLTYSNSKWMVEVAMSAARENAGFMGFWAFLAGFIDGGQRNPDNLITARHYIDLVVFGRDRMREIIDDLDAEIKAVNNAAN